MLISKGFLFSYFDKEGGRNKLVFSDHNSDNIRFLIWLWSPAIIDRKYYVFIHTVKKLSIEIHWSEYSESIGVIRCLSHQESIHDKTIPVIQTSLHLLALTHNYCTRRPHGRIDPFLFV